VRPPPPPRCAGSHAAAGAMRSCGWRGLIRGMLAGEHSSGIRSPFAPGDLRESRTVEDSVALNDPRGAIIHGQGPAGGRVRSKRSGARRSVAPVGLSRAIGLSLGGPSSPAVQPSPARNAERALWPWDGDRPRRRLQTCAPRCRSVAWPASPWG
jgi:hypothetical protein